MFYKEENGELLTGTHIESNGYVLIAEFKDDYTYPVDNWYWFDTVEEANTFFNL